jgi:hypothetical protein
MAKLALLTSSERAKQYFLFFFSGFVSLIFAVPVIIDPSLMVQSDNYLALAESWVSTGSPQFNNFGPSYIVLLIILNAISSALNISAFTLILLLQIILSAASVSIVYALFSGYFESKKNLVFLGCLLLALSPLRNIYTTAILTETFYIFLLVLFILILLRGLQTKSTGLLLFSALILSVATLTRGSALLLMALTFAVLFYLTFIKKTQTVRHLLYFVIISSSLPLMWSYENHRLYGHFAPTSSGGYNFAALMVGPAKQKLEGAPRGANVDIWLQGDEVFENGFEQADYVKARALEFFRENRVLVVRENLVGYVRAMVGSAHAHANQLYGIAAIGWVGSLMRLVLYATIFSYFLLGLTSRRVRALFFVFGVLFVTHVVPAGAAGYSRFSLPLDVFAYPVFFVALQFLNDRRKAWMGGGQWA